MRYEIEPEYPGQVPELIARIQATGAEARGFIKELLQESAELGRRVAESQAPRGNLFDHHGGGISDSIQISSIRYAPGGAGGGGFYEIDLYADSAIAPHLKYVFEGTADEGVGKIYPARGNVFTFQKDGEERKFRPWIHGQRPQTAWWEHAHDAVDANISSGIQGMNLGNL